MKKYSNTEENICFIPLKMVIKRKQDEKLKLFGKVCAESVNDGLPNIDKNIDEKSRVKRLKLLIRGKTILFLRGDAEFSRKISYCIMFLHCKAIVLKVKQVRIIRYFYHLNNAEENSAKKSDFYIESWMIFKNNKNPQNCMEKSFFPSKREKIEHNGGLFRTGNPIPPHFNGNGLLTDFLFQTSGCSDLY